MLDFAELRDGTLHLTAAGRALAAAGLGKRNRLFAEHLLRSVPLVSYIRRVLEDRPSHQAPRSRFLTELEDHLSTRDAEHTLTAVIDWGRYAEIFTYGHKLQLFGLSRPCDEAERCAWWLERANPLKALSITRTRDWRRRQDRWPSSPAEASPRSDRPA